MRSLFLLVAWILLSWSLLLPVERASGQASQGVRRVIDISEVKRDMKNIALAFHNYEAANNRAPKKVEDLAPYYENNARITDLLKKGTYVFHYNLSIRQMTNGSSKTILCYEKDADDRNNRVVAMGDGSVHVLATPEFQKIMKAQGK